MHRNDRFRSLSHCGLDLIEIEVKRFRINIDEDWSCTDRTNRFCGGDKGEGRCDSEFGLLTSGGAEEGGLVSAERDNSAATLLVSITGVVIQRSS